MPRGNPKPKRTFADIAASYPQYDPEVEGYGSPETWVGSFRARLGFEEAERVVHGANDTPRGILGLPKVCTWEQVRTEYRKLVLANHPDRAVQNGQTVDAATEAFKRINAAYVVLQREFGKD